MDWEEWEPFYSRILEEFSFSRRKDAQAGRVLRGLVGEEQRVELEDLKALLENQKVNVFGAGPSLDGVKYMSPGLKVAADGATTFLIERDVFPQLIVTDLDGNVEDQIEASDEGSIAVIHAHGDNISRLKKYVPEFKRVVPSMQCRSIEGVYNFGGFTDGDRAVSMSCHFGAGEVSLCGFDFQGGIGRYSLSRDWDMKLKKLHLAQEIVEYLAKSCNISGLDH